MPLRPKVLCVMCDITWTLDWPKDIEKKNNKSMMSSLPSSIGMVKSVSGSWDCSFMPLLHIFSIPYAPVLLSCTSGLCVVTSGGCAPDASLWGLSAVVIAEEQFPFTGLLTFSSGGQATGQCSPSKPSISQNRSREGLHSQP